MWGRWVKIQVSSVGLKKTNINILQGDRNSNTYIDKYLFVFLCGEYYYVDKLKKIWFCAKGMDQKNEWH